MNVPIEFLFQLYGEAMVKIRLLENEILRLSEPEKEKEE